MSVLSASIFLSRRLRRSVRIQRLPQCLIRNPPCSTRLLSSSAMDPKNSTLSERMSFLFEQIEALERERAEKDNTLQRIREWHHSKGNSQPNLEKRRKEIELRDSEGSRASASQLRTKESNSVEVETCDANHPLSSSGKPEKAESIATDDSTVCLAQLKKLSDESSGMVVEMTHPWPEWIELMERLVQQNYFDHVRKDENKMMEEIGLNVGAIRTNVCADELGVDLNDIKSVKNACLNFGKDRFDILRSISKRDIQALVGYGCPTTDRKVVFSAKFLRKYAHIDEGDVCSNCSMRTTCDKAFLLSLKEEEARTVDLMRVLLAYGLDHSFHTVTNNTLSKHKTLKTVVRKILHEIVKLSSVPIDPNLPRPIVKRPPPKVKQPPPTAKKRVGRNDIDMKKGDWVCPKCDFMNFAKNTVCLQCDAKRPKRQLLPGEWECPQCSFLNYRRNMVCFHCECKRPQDDFVEAMMEERQRVPGTVPNKTVKRSDVSHAWNFDFDDDESDGADVAAFEYADSTNKSAVAFPVDDQIHLGNSPQSDASHNRGGKNMKIHDQIHSGFNDFDDDFDIDNNELDTQAQSGNTPKSSNNYSFVQMSDLEISEGSDSDVHLPAKSRAPPKKLSRRAYRKDSISDLNNESDDDFSDEPKLRSSHVADTKYRSGDRGQKRSSFRVDERMELSSEDDNGFSSRSLDARKKMTRRGNSRSSDTDDESSFSGSDSDSESRIGTKMYHRDFGRKSGNDRMTVRRPLGRDKEYDNSRSQYTQNERFSRQRGLDRDTDAKFRKPRMETSGRNSWNDGFEKPSSGFYRQARGNYDDMRQGRRRDDREGDTGTFRNSRRVIER